MNAGKAIALGIAIAAGTVRAEGPPDVLFSGGARDGYASAELDTFVAPSDANARFAGGSFDGYSCTRLDTYVPPPGLHARFAGGAHDGSDAAAAGPFPNPLNRDTDGDGIPDWWSAGYFHTVTGAPTGADTDGDGMNTLEEYCADTDPLDGNSLFGISALVLSTNADVFVARSSSNRLYTFECATNVSAGAWMPVAGAPPRAGIGGPDHFTDPSVSTQLIYRIRVELP